MSEKVSNFDVLKRMSELNKDIRLYPDTTTMNYSHAKKVSKITFGANGNIVNEIFSDRLRVMMLAFNVEQFNELKASMEQVEVPDEQA